MSLLTGGVIREGSMKKLTTLTLSLILLGVTLLVKPTVQVSADGDDGTAETTTHTETSAVYSYTAQAGDSYTVLARKAVQTYGLENKVNLSGAQIVFTETNLTKDAGSPAVNLGQKVELKKDAVNSVVEKAQKLTDAQKKAWNYYVQFVDFDTRDNGEKH